MKFRVKQNHIDKGVQCSHSQCPIALCLSDRFPKLDVYVGTFSAAIGTHEYKLDLAAVRFIRQFDAGFTVWPATFTMHKRL
jgi:hypothetical protein